MWSTKAGLSSSPHYPVYDSAFQRRLPSFSLWLLVKKNIPSPPPPPLSETSTQHWAVAQFWWSWERGYCRCFPFGEQYLTLASLGTSVLFLKSVLVLRSSTLRTLEMSTFQNMSGNDTQAPLNQRIHCILFKHPKHLLFHWCWNQSPQQPLFLPISCLFYTDPVNTTRFLFFF